MNEYEELLEKLNHSNILNRDNMRLIKQVLNRNLPKSVNSATRGKFPNYDEMHTYHTTYQCPNCKCTIHLDWHEFRNYCPQCGQKITLPKDDNIGTIDSFKGEYSFLSNFYESKFVYEGRMYRNSEAAFQAQKCPERADEFISLRADKAKELGRNVNLRADWEAVKYSIMEDIVRAKFNYNPSLKTLLLNTEGAELIEGNSWNDTYWGVCNGVGENKLGKILMSLRMEFASDL